MQALIDHTPRDVVPRSIDGIILTKFDTIDDKVRVRPQTPAALYLGPHPSPTVSSLIPHCTSTMCYEQVGASLSMVYKTRQPIVFVGNGQHYTNLHVLNVNFVVRALLS